MKNWLNRLLGIRKDASNEAPDHQRQEPGEGSYDGFNALDIVLRMLQNLQAEWATRKYGDEGLIDVHFHYQRGDFHVICPPDGHQVYIQFLFFHDAPMGQLDNVRDACNQFNQKHPSYKVLYSLQPDKHLVHMHVQTSLRLTLWNKDLENDFADALTLCFESARAYRRQLEEIVDNDVYNLEEIRAFGLRELHLAHETEMKHQAYDWHTYDTQHLTLADAMAMLLDTDKTEFRRLTVVGDATSIVDDAEAIAHTDLTALLADTEAEIPSFCRQQTTLIVEAVFGGQPQTFILHIAAEAEAEDALYFRLTFVQPDRQLGPGSALDSRSADDRRAQTIVMSFSKKTTRERQAEFDYLWQEALQHKAQGAELQPEERFITLCEEPDIAFNLYWGQRFYLAERHYEALLYLENAYNSLHGAYHDLDRDQRRQFFELTYYIGLCCMHLGMPHRAYYYLDGLFNRSNLRYTQAYINSLVASHDYRALSIVDNVLSNLQRVYDEQEADEAHRNQLYAFLLFLRRSKARVLVQARRLDAAEALLKDLLKTDNTHERYILEQLAHIAHLRAVAASSPRPDTLSISAEFPKSAEN